MTESKVDIPQNQGSTYTNGEDHLWDAFEPADPSIFDPLVGHRPDFPVDAFFGEALGAQIRALAHEGDTSACSLSQAVLCGMAGLVGNSIRAAVHPRWDQACVWRVAIIGDASAGKTQAFRPIESLVWNIERRANKELGPAMEEWQKGNKDHERAVKAWEAACKQIEAKNYTLQSRGKPLLDLPDEPELDPLYSPANEPSMLQLLVDDTTIEAAAAVMQENPRGLIRLSDELEPLFSSNEHADAGAHRAFWKKANQGGPHKVNRQKYPVPYWIDKLSISVYGNLPVKPFASAVENSEEDGMLERFLFVVPVIHEGYVLPRQFDESQHLENLVGACFEVPYDPDDDGRYKSRRVTMTDDAADWFETWVNKHKRAIKDHPPRLRGTFGKLQGKAVVLALLREMVVWGLDPMLKANSPDGPPYIGLEATKLACSIVDEFYKPHLVYAYGIAVAGADSDRAIAREIALHLRREQVAEVNLSHLRRANVIKGYGKSAKVREQVAEILVSSGVLARARTNASAGGRRPALYLVAPWVQDA